VKGHKKTSPMNEEANKHTQYQRIGTSRLSLKRINSFFSSFLY